MWNCHWLFSGCHSDQSCQVQCDGSSVGGSWSDSNSGFLSTYTVGSILPLGHVWRLERVEQSCVLPLRVEPYVCQTHFWPAAGWLICLHHCADFGIGLAGVNPLAGWGRGARLSSHQQPGRVSHLTGAKWQWKRISVVGCHSQKKSNSSVIVILVTRVHCKHCLRGIPVPASILTMVCIFITHHRCGLLVYSRALWLQYVLLCRTTGTGGAIISVEGWAELHGCAYIADRGATRYNTGCSWWQDWMICLFPSAGFPHATECDCEVGWIHCVGSGRLVGLYHRTHCVECGIESDSFSLGWLHVGVIHWVLKRRLAIGALMANIAIELDLWACPVERKGKRCNSACEQTQRQRK